MVTVVYNIYKGTVTAKIKSTILKMLLSCYIYLKVEENRNIFLMVCKIIKSFYA